MASHAPCHTWGLQKSMVLHNWKSVCSSLYVMSISHIDTYTHISYIHTYTSLFLYSCLPSQHSGCFRILINVKNAAMNTAVQTSRCSRYEEGCKVRWAPTSSVPSQKPTAGSWVKSETKFALALPSPFLSSCPRVGSLASDLPRHPSLSALHHPNTC